MLIMEKKPIPSSIFFLFALFISLATFVSFTKESEHTTATAQSTTPQRTVVASGLKVPWSLVFLPNGNMLVTERGGTIKLIDKTNGSVLSTQTISGVKAISEGGLLGIALHPNFANNNYVYLYHTYSSNGSNTLNKVVRYTYSNNQFTSPIVIVDAIPGAGFHNGGRIKFGPDGFLYIGAGDAGTTSLAQDRNSRAGKILRVTDVGQPANGNPFGTIVYSYGHRNPQGLTWNGTTLYETEHGNSTLDELNIIEAGKNYGWPTIQGNQTATNMITPIRNSGSDTWAPSGAAYYNGSVFFAGLRGQALYEAPTQSGSPLKIHFKDQIGRIRDVVVGPDNQLYIINNNTNDDKIFRVSFGNASPTSVLPTFGCMGSPSSICPTLPSGSPSTNPSSGVTPSTPLTPVPSSGMTGTPTTPCEAETVSVQHNKKKKHAKKKRGGIQNGMSQFIRFLIELINLILKLIGGGQVPLTPTDPCNATEPSPSEAPNASPSATHN